MTLNLPKGLSLPSTLQHLLGVHGEELTLISFTKNSVGKFFITRGCIDLSANFISFEIIRDFYSYTLRYFPSQLRRANAYEVNVKSIDRFSHTYFRNCMRERNQRDESIKSLPAVFVSKRQPVYE